jgi:hypothetical protein
MLTHASISGVENQNIMVRFIVQFEDPELQRFMQKANAVPVGNLSPECRPIFNLMEAFGWYRVVDSEPLPFQRPWQPQTPRVKLIIGRLTSTELRPALRAWYRQSPAEMNSFASDFRDVLSELVGEKL